jgi:GAF domain-containing protein
MGTDEGGLDTASAVLALTEGATHGRGPSGVLAALVDTAHTLLGAAAAAVTGDAHGVDPGSLVASPGDPDGLLAAAFEDGPGRDCVRSGRPVVCDDVTAERPRWLRFAAKAAGAGVRGAWAVPVRREAESMGALVLLDGPGRPDLGLAGTLAEAAAVGLRHAHALHSAEAVGEQLREALRSRVVIEQAKGALALYAGLDVEEAFVVLRRYARRRGLGLTDLARRVVTGGIDLSAVAPGGPPSLS